MTTGTRLSVVFADVYEDLELAYQGKNKYGGDVAEIYAYRLVERHRNRPIGAHDFTDQDAHDARENLRALCRDFRAEHPDAVFGLELREPRLFEDVDIDEPAAFRPFSHRIHIKVYPRPVDDPKVCVTLGWKFGSGSRRKFRVIVDGTYVTVEDQREDRLGQAFWMPYDDARGVSCEKLIGTALGAIVRGELERSYRNGVIYIDVPGDFEEED